MSPGLPSFNVDAVASFSPAQSLAEAEAQLATILAAAGIDEARRDAKRLLEGLLGIDGVALLTKRDMEIGAAAERLTDAARRRLMHEPVSRILGVRNFYGRDFIVTPDVLDPRADTEAVIDLALELLGERGAYGKALKIADIGTGSGALVATLLSELPDAFGFATDISPSALAIARRNAERLSVDKRVKFIEGSVLEGCPEHLDLIVSNPPYIPTADLAHLEPDVRDFDPRISLDGGADGLDIYRAIATGVGRLSEHALIVVEVGAGQASDVTGIFRHSGAELIRDRTDLGGHVRAVALEIHCQP